MAELTHTRSSRTVILINTIVIGLLAGLVGLVTGDLWPWLFGGVVAGLAIGWGVEAVCRRWPPHPRLYRLRLLGLIFIELLVIVYIGIPVYYGYANDHPVRFPITITPAELNLSYEDVELTANDGVVLKGWYVPPKNGAVIIALHGFNGNRTHVLNHAAALIEHGYGVLMFDMRAHGESGGEHFGAGWTSDRDVVAAVDYLRQRADVQPDRIGGLGLSSGAQVLLYGALRTESLRALWLDGTGVSRYEDFADPFIPDVEGLWFMSPMVWMSDRMVELFCGCAANVPFKEAVTQIAPRPMMFVAAGQAPYEISLARRYAANARGSAGVWELLDAAHIGGLFSYPTEYARRMIEFFDRTLLP